MPREGVETFGPGTSDERLAELSAAGSERAFAALVDRHQAPLARFCGRLGGAGGDVDDVVQATFASAWTALHEGTHVMAVRGWLYRIARHEAIDRHRRRGAAVVPLPEALAAPGGLGGDLQTDVAATLDGLRALPDAQRRALIGTAVQGRSHRDVADELGMTDTAVRGLVFRARAAMRTAVGGFAPAPLLALVRRLAMTAEVSAGGDVPAVAKVVAVTLSAGVLAGGAGVAIHKADPEPARHHAAPPAQTVRRAAAPAPSVVSTPTPSEDRRAAAHRR